MRNESRGLVLLASPSIVETGPLSRAATATVTTATAVTAGSMNGYSRCKKANVNGCCCQLAVAMTVTWMLSTISTTMAAPFHIRNFHPVRSQGMETTLLSFESFHDASVSSSLRNWNSKRHTSILDTTSILLLRGGALSPEAVKKPKRAKRSSLTKKKKSKVFVSAKKVLNQGLAEMDAADALGDAIRNRASVLLQQEHSSESINTSINSDSKVPLSSSFPMLQSVGQALGASDHTVGDDESETFNGGVPVASTSVVVHYFLKSHGGAHAVQTLCSVLAATAGVAAILLPITVSSSSSVSGSSTSTQRLQLSLLRRCLTFALIKHVAGLVAAVYVSATRLIPAVGFRQTRVELQELVTNPIAYYIFYAAIILLWLPSPSLLIQSVPAATGTTAAATAISTSSLVWWQSYRGIPLLILAPVVLREVVSTALVISDVLVLWAYSTTSPNERDGNNGTSHWIQRGLSVAQALVNAVMSLLVTPAVWRTASAAQRQAILAKLTSKSSLVLEVCVGLVLLMDCILRGIGVLFLAGGTSSTGSSAGSGGLGAWIKSLICTRLYAQFLWTRRRKITRLASTLRGGAARVPLYVLTFLLDPSAALGLEQQAESSSHRNNDSNVPSKDRQPWTLIEYVRVAVCWDD
jgi:hypothetical protein